MSILDLDVKNLPIAQRTVTEFPAMISENHIQKMNYPNPPLPHTHSEDQALHSTCQAAHMFH